MMITLPELADLPPFFQGRLSNVLGVLYYENRRIPLPGGTYAGDAVVVTDVDGNLITEARANAFNKTYLQLATEMNQRGLDAAKPMASAANVGYFYFSTDISGGTLYRSNGVTWDVEATAGGGGLTFQTVALSAGAIDGANMVFTWAQPPLMIFWQGQKLVLNALINGYTLAGNVSTHTEAPGSGEALEAYASY